MARESNVIPSTMQDFVEKVDDEGSSDIVAFMTRCVLCFGVIGMHECQLVRPLPSYIESLQYSRDSSLLK